MKRTVLALSLLWVLAGTAPASAAFLGENPRLGESFLGKGIGPAAGDVSRELPPASGGSCLERPAECFVAPAAVDYTTGRLGGQLYGADKLQTLGNYLDRRGITLLLDDARLPATKGGAFIGQTGEMLLRSDATQYEVWHELLHYRQYSQIGSEAYLNLERPLVPEQAVYDAFRSSARRWGGPNNPQPLLNLQEKVNAMGQVENAGGQAW